MLSWQSHSSCTVCNCLDNLPCFTNTRHTIADIQAIESKLIYDYIIATLIINYIFIFLKIYQVFYYVKDIDESIKVPFTEEFKFWSGIELFRRLSIVLLATIFPDNSVRANIPFLSF